MLKVILKISGNTEILGFLISNGAGVDSIAESGTPLHRAAANGKKDAVKLLLGHHANVRSLFSVCVFSISIIILILHN